MQQLKSSTGRRLPSYLIFVCFLASATIDPGSRSIAAGNNKGKLNDPNPSYSEVSKAIELAAGYLQRACGPDGAFVYQVDPSTAKASSHYNVIRHAGAIYALAMFNRARSTPAARDAMVRAALFLRQNYIANGALPGQLAIWSDPLAKRIKVASPVASLGGTGLGLVALAAVEEAVPGTIAVSDLQALGRFLLFLQREDGRFVSKYAAGEGPVSNWESLYYPGEAALGLISLYQIDPAPEWLAAAARALSYVARSRTGLSHVPPDHWALIASAALFQLSDPGQSPDLRKELIQYAIRVSDSILKDQVTTSPAGTDGAFDQAGSTASAATRLEGLMAALGFLPKDDLSNSINLAVARGTGFLLRAQITSGQFAGGLPQESTSNPSHSVDIRIDYVQHALCAWLRYLQITSRPSSFRIGRESR